MFFFSTVGSILAPQICIICQKNKRHPKSSGFEDPIKCITTSSAQILIGNCTSGNEYQQAQISGLSEMDVIVTDFHFHRTCYRQISKSFDPCNSDSETRKKCFHDLVSYIEDIVINEGEVVRISCISKIYENIQKDKGIASQRTSHFLLKARLQNHFKGRIDFFRKNGTSIDLTYGTSKEPIQFTRDTTEKKVKKVVAIIRDKIKDFKDHFSSWPPPSNEFLPENIEIPPLLYTLLRELLTTGTENKRTSRLVKSIRQDILYNSSNGRIKTKKQLQLGVFTKIKAGSKLLIECQNKLGHSVSYYEVNHVETFTAENESKNTFLQN